MDDASSRGKELSGRHGEGVLVRDVCNLRTLPDLPSYFVDFVIMCRFSGS